MEETLIVQNGKVKAEDAQAALAPRPAAKPQGRPKAAWLAAAAAVLAVAGAGAYLYMTAGRETTDDAFVEGHVVPVSPKISGHVARLLVDDNQEVHKGELLAEIDPSDFAARRDLAAAKVRGAEARLRQAKADLSRYEALAAKDEATRQTLDNALAARDSAEADLAANRAGLRQAELDFSYTRIEAPADGRVTRKSVEEGAYVNVGQALMAVVPARVWVVANFKETQLNKIRPGQRALVKVDAYSSTLSGRVDSIQSGTGARFSLLPPENATGNYVKVVQRVPVKIALDDTARAQRLSPGLSVEAIVEAD